MYAIGNCYEVRFKLKEIKLVIRDDAGKKLAIAANRSKAFHLFG